MASPVKQRKGKAKDSDFDSLNERQRRPKTQQKADNKPKSASKGGFPLITIVLTLLAAGGAYLVRHVAFSCSEALSMNDNACI